MVMGKAAAGIAFFCLFGVCDTFPTPAERDELMRLEQFKITGGNLVSSVKELQVNDILKKIKGEEIDRGTASGRFPPSVHFFSAKELIDESAVFNVIRKMPKGAALHLHDYALLSVEWLVKNGTYLPHCYVCFTAEQGVRFHFFSKGPGERLPECSEWVLLETYRKQLHNVTEFDNSLLQNFTLVTENPEKAYPTQAVIWKKFEEIFMVAASLISYAPVFKAYFYQALQEFYDDNVQYIELRSLLIPVYELDGTLHDKEWSIVSYREVARRFRRDNPDFMGAKYKPWSIDPAQVGREDAGHPLWYFKDVLLIPAEKKVKMPFFFHAGETDWEGMSTDENILDALILNTSRIGHGYGIIKHPIAKNISRELDVPLEICPISNQVLLLLTDLRNHPAAVLMAESHPLVISSDDPAIFGARGLSYDFYEAFMGIGGSKADLMTLKQFALNSIKYSAMSPAMKEETTRIWQKKWDKFLDEVLHMLKRDEL
uniref:Adenosine deaminase 2b n=1 Tax=Callorhinchus milii TaxID=7868 RepID=A0A4W3IDH0_CALMI